MAEYADWVNEVSQNIYDIPRATIISAVRNAIIEFCVDTLVWTEKLPELAFDSTQSEYVLDLPYASTIEHFWTLDGFKKTNDDEWNQARNFLVNGSVITFVEPTREPKFDDATIRPIVSLKPSRSSQTCPDFMLDNYFYAILSKALVILASQPSADWSTRPDLISIHELKYQDGVKKAISDRNNRIGMPKPRNTTRTYFI